MKLLRAMDTFPIFDEQHLTAAEAWLELGNHIEANAELEKLPALLRAHPMVLGVRWRICAMAEKWELCADIGQALVDANPKDPAGWINRSIALHKLKRTDEAFKQLEPAAHHFHSVEIIPYNLACYSCQLGNLDEAWDWLVQAFGTAKDEAAIKSMALDDRDLEPLWAEIGEV